MCGAFTGIVCQAQQINAVFKEAFCFGVKHEIIDPLFTNCRTFPNSFSHYIEQLQTKASLPG